MFFYNLPNAEESVAALFGRPGPLKRGSPLKIADERDALSGREFILFFL